VRLVRVLLVNKFFHPRAGAETSFLQTRRLLLDRGHEVIDFAMQHEANLPSPYARFFAPRRSYDNGTPIAKRAVDAASTLYSRSARRALSNLLDVHPPDVAHLHNIYHQLTLSIIDELAQRRIPTVLTLHDWKVACPAYTLFTEGQPCRRCPSGSVVNAVRHRCVKSSASASAVAAGEAWIARRRGSYDKVQRFIAPSRFAVDVAALGGITRERVTHIPNFLPDDELNIDAPAGDAGPQFIFAGRLEETKGIRNLLEAFARVEAPASLRIAGRGPLESEVRAAATRDSRVRYLGMLSRTELFEELGAARAALLPSLYEDNGPLIILEAQARAKAMIVTDRGGPPEFVRHEETGLVVDPERVDDLSAAMTRLALDGELARRLGARARDHVRREHSATHHYELLTKEYEMAKSEVM
jgi:glycosyltransferase involved in cell wall biosynthesis